MTSERGKLDVAFFAWLQRRIEELPSGGTLTVTFRRDKRGQLVRNYEVHEGRLLTPSERQAHT